MGFRRWIGLIWLIAGCDGMIMDARGGEAPLDDPTGPAPPASCEMDPDAGALEPLPPPAPVSYERLLRRVHLILHGRPPLEEDAARLDAASTDAEREAVIASAIDEGLASPDFYLQMLDFGHHFLRNGSYTTGAAGDGYMGNMSAHLDTCDDGSAHPGAYYLIARGGPGGRGACDDPAAVRREIEPWWAPGTTVTMLGDAGNEERDVVDGDGAVHDCGIAFEEYYNMQNADGCGCGPHAVWCYPGPGLHIGHNRQGSQRRDMWDEPARFFAHLAWHDLPISDLVLGNYTVANNRVRAWYLRFGRQTSIDRERLDADATWFRPEAGDLPRDPLHPDPTDPEAWRELVAETLAPQLLSLSGGVRSNDPSRTLRWDPRTDSGPAPGLPFAGVLTMAGPNSTFPRERPRAARFIEIFTCREFEPPPADQHFPELGRDIATTGTCMHCHTLMDPVAMAFRRWVFMGNYVPRPYLADLETLPVPEDLYDPARRYPNGRWYGAGAARWRDNWLSGTVMTPATDAELAHPRALFLDTIPPEYTVLGVHSDGTMGPLGFGKILVESGELDRCMARRIYERILGRPLDPTTEARYIDALARELVEEGRRVRPFVRHLLASDELRRAL